MSLREVGKRKRRGRILAAAEALIRKSGGVTFSMRDLAKQAGVAFVTPFNLFENKGGIIVALFEERLRTQQERIVSGDEDDDPVERLFDLAARSCRAYAADPELHRPLLRALPGVETLGGTPLFALATELWLSLLREAERAGRIEAGRDLDLLARTMHVTFRGAISLWASGEIDACEFERQAQYAVGACLLAVLTAKHRERVSKRICGYERRDSIAVDVE